VPSLSAEGVRVRFGGALALDDASIEVNAGTVTGLIGPNGAGKTTLFNVVTGLLRPQRGRVVLDGRDITRKAPHQRARLGVARTFQRLELFTSLSVRDNIRVAGDIHKAWSRRRGRTDGPADVDEIIELTGLGPIADREVSEIPTGSARVVEVARALMTRPSVLLLDEPASGQDDMETQRFGQLLVELAGQGTAVVLVEHDMSLVMEVCHKVHVLNLGRNIATGEPHAVQNDHAVLDAYLGTSKEAAS
jgi:branched-chain amino acid transport system ATP-binding protein